MTSSFPTTIYFYINICTYIHYSHTYTYINMHIYLLIHFYIYTHRTQVSPHKAATRKVKKLEKLQHLHSHDKYHTEQMNEVDSSNAMGKHIKYNRSLSMGKGFKLSLSDSNDRKAVKPKSIRKSIRGMIKYLRKRKDDKDSPSNDDKNSGFTPRTPDWEGLTRPEGFARPMNRMPSTLGSPDGGLYSNYRYTINIYVHI
jgi:hypothetical protein